MEPQFTFNPLLYGVVPILYLVATFGAFPFVTQRRDVASFRAVSAWKAFGFTQVLLFLAIILHGVVLRLSVFPNEGLHFGFAHALSVVFWLAAVIYAIESLREPLVPMRVFILPGAAVFSVLPSLFPGSSVVILASHEFRLHVLLSMLAYSTLTIAVLHALLMAFLEKRLHASPAWAESPVGGASTFLMRVFEALPPLLTLERMLFRLIGLGFVLLSLSMALGVATGIHLTGHGLRFDHKTLFSVLSWAIFGILLLGRWWRGWRGKLALRLTLIGFVTLFLSYVGSRFVLEVILGR